MSLKQTHTFATLEVSIRTFNEIKRKLKEAKYDHSFVDETTIDMRGIGLVPPKPKKGKPLRFCELKFAAENGIPVWYVEKYHNPHDRHMNFNGVTVMKKATVGYYIGNSDVDPDQYYRMRFARDEFPEGSWEVFGVKGNKYT